MQLNTHTKMELKYVKKINKKNIKNIYNTVAFCRYTYFPNLHVTWRARATLFSLKVLHWLSFRSQESQNKASTNSYLAIKFFQHSSDLTIQAERSWLRFQATVNVCFLRGNCVCMNVWQTSFQLGYSQKKYTVLIISLNDYILVRSAIHQVCYVIHKYGFSCVPLIPHRLVDSQLLVMINLNSECFNMTKVCEVAGRSTSKSDLPR